MTNYDKWDKAAKELVEEADEDDKAAKAECDKALGLEDGPKGPPTEQAAKQRKELEDHSEKRKEFIDYSKAREVTLTHPKQDEPIQLDSEDLQGKAVKLQGSKGVTYIVPEPTESAKGILKLTLEKCESVTVQVRGTIKTSTIDIFRCSDVEVELQEPLGTVQADECAGSVIFRFAERDHIGKAYHQNCPKLQLGWGGSSSDYHTIGRSVEAQFVTMLAAGHYSGGPFVTAPVVRGEGEFPMDIGLNGSASLPGVGLVEPDAEAAPAAEERKRKAEAKRLEGNEMFRASDYVQAAVSYSQSLELDPDVAPVWANRAQCWLKAGDLEKALSDATKCTEVDPKYSKGWFRKGMSLHGLKRHREAIPALLEAEKLEPNNKQTQEAIKFAQLLARKQAADGS